MMKNITTLTAYQFFNGDPFSGRWSIGPHSPKTNSLGAIGNLLGNQTGICAYGHLRSEGDASITRGDWLAPTMASNCISYPQFLQELFDVADEMGGGLITPRVLAQHSSNRKKYSVANNPNYCKPAHDTCRWTKRTNSWQSRHHMLVLPSLLAPTCSPSSCWPTTLLKSHVVS